MPRYYFTSENGKVTRDPSGADLADLDAARNEAVAFAGAILNDTPAEVLDAGRWRVVVAEGERQAVFAVEVRVREANDIAVWTPPSEG